MTHARSARGTLLWAGALVLTLAALALDSRARLASIEQISSLSVGAPVPPSDPGSPSGYAWGQHRTILPAIDGYHWILQSESMLAGGGARVRSVAYDDAPVGREVHWSGVMRWWAAGLAALERATHADLSWGRALERVTPWANTAILALLLVSVTPLLAARLGAVAAALFAMGTVAVFPFYEYFVVGYFDHHGVATMGCVLAVLFLVAGGAGWVASDPDRTGGASGSSAPRLRLPTAAGARRWFVASAAAGGASLWVNAATIVPVLAGIGLAVLLAELCLAHDAVSQRAPWVADPSLWRLWGWTGALVGLGFYLLEYFPGHLGLRLEVNHPLYAVAWAGGGDLLYRVGSERRSSDRAWIALDVVALALVPALMWLGGVSAFRLSDPFLFALHQRFIVEFLPLRGQLARMAPAVIAGRVSPLPLLALPLSALLWRTEAQGGKRWAWRAALALVAACALWFAYVVLEQLLGGRVGLALAGTALLAGTIGLSARGEGRPLAAPVRAALSVALIPATLIVGLSYAQVRWVGVGAALWLAALVASASLLPLDAAFSWTGGRRAVAGGLLVAVFVVCPAFYVPLPLDTADPPQEAARDVSWWLRRRVAGRGAVVLTTPNATTWMAYFGGLPGVGSLYWENLDGLRAATDMAIAPTADSLRTLLAGRGVTHVVLYPWEQGFEQLRLARAGGDPRGLAPGFLDGLVGAMRPPGIAELPAWLAPLPYPAPDAGGLGHPSALVFEVVPEQPRAAALVRLARYYQAIGSPDQTEAALRASLAAGPTVPALALLAQMEAARQRREAFEEAVTGLRRELGRDDPLDPADRLDAAIALAVARDGAGAARELDRVLTEADEASLRALSPDALAILVQLAKQLGMDRTHPQTVSLAAGLLPPG